MKIGVVSDTHGLIRKSVIKNLKGVDLIIHAGDIGKPAIITTLKQIAPVVAVRGNIDQEAWAQVFPLTYKVKINEMTILVVHNIDDLTTEDEGQKILIYGHTHKPNYEIKGETIYLNPGSIGPRRYNLPVSMSYLWIKGKEVKYKFIYLSEAEK